MEILKKEWRETRRMRLTQKEPVLDSSQRQFCFFEGGTIRLLAPAGSGKTLSLLYRCKTLAERSTRAKPRFLLFTFTRAARDELRDRLKSSKTFESVAPLIQVSTLNAWGWRQIKNQIPNCRLISSPTERFFCVQNLLRPVWLRHEPIRKLLEDSRRKNKASKELLDLLDRLKSMAFRHDELDAEDKIKEHVRYLASCGLHAHVELFLKNLADMELVRERFALNDFSTKFFPFYRDATEFLYQTAQFSLEDQKYWAWLLLDRRNRTRGKLPEQSRFHHILVDEFQDINPLDLALLKAIASVNQADLTIVGDDDQAIYEWRGATPEFILEPQTHIGKKYATCILDKNYRSPKNIVELSQLLIAHNRRRVHKRVTAHQTTNAHIEIVRCDSISHSVDTTTKLVLELLRRPDCENVVLIGRKRSQIIPYQIVFAGLDIPFYAAEDLHVLLSDAFNSMKEMLAIRGRAHGAVSFGSDVVKDALHLCDKVKRYPLSKSDREALRNYLYRSGPKTLLDAARLLYRYVGPLKGSNEGGRMSQSFGEAIVRFLTARTVSETIEAISDNFEGLQKDYGKAIEDIFYTDPPFLYLAEFAQKYGANFEAFFADIERAIATLARVPPVEEDDQPIDEGLRLPLHLMTALRAKGREFDAVVILDANDGVWPAKLAKTEQELEQERRLFYVAVTRARRYLYFVVNDNLMREVAVATPYLVEMGLLRP